jgi:hypothetical protein
VKQITILFALMLGAFGLSAKDGYKMKVTIDDNNDTMVYLCNYYGEAKRVFKIDSARLKPGSNTFTLTGDKKLTGGIYILLFADKTMQFEVMMGNGDDIEVSFNKLNPYPSAKFKNSPTNTEFYRYQNFVQDLGPRMQKIQASLANAKTKADTTKVNDENIKINKEITDYRNNYIKSNPTTMLTTLFKALKDPEVPEAITKLTNKKTKDSLSYIYYKAHYWDEFNFQDDRIIYTPIYESKLQNYYDNLVIKSVDSVIKEINWLMNKTKGTEDLYKFTFWWQAKYVGNSKIMGLDEAYAYMIENYVMRDLCPWIDDSTKKNYEKDFRRISPNTIGKAAAEIDMMNYKDEPAKLSTTVFSKDYTVVAFFDPTCHHCQEEIPAMDSTIRSVNKKLKIKIGMFGVQNAAEDKKWRDMIAKEKLSDDLWVHVYDPTKTKLGNVTAAYGVLANPAFYVLDAEGKIVGKRVDHTNIAGLFEFLEKRKQEKK